MISLGQRVESFKKLMNTSLYLIIAFVGRLRRILSLPHAIFSRVHATLHPDLSVRPSVGRWVGPHFTFLSILFLLVILDHMRVYLVIGGVGNNELWKCQSDTWPNCAQKQYINTCERKKG